MARVVLFEDERGYLLMDGNELTIGSKIDDPPKVRLTAPTYATGGGGGVVSFNRSRTPSVVCFGQDQGEMAMIRVEQAEDVRGDAANLKAEINFMLEDGSGAQPDSMRKPLAFVWNAITRLLLSFGAGRPDTMWAPNGLSFTQQQNDGNFVTYRVSQPFDKTASPVALWASGTNQ